MAGVRRVLGSPVVAVDLARDRMDVGACLRGGHGGGGGAVGGGPVERVAAGQQSVVERGRDGADHFRRVGSRGQFPAFDGLADAPGPFLDTGRVEAVQGLRRALVTGGGGDHRLEQGALARVGQGLDHEPGVGPEVLDQRAGVRARQGLFGHVDQQIGDQTGRRAPAPVDGRLAHVRAACDVGEVEPVEAVFRQGVTCRLQHGRPDTGGPPTGSDSAGLHLFGTHNGTPVSLLSALVLCYSILKELQTR